MEALTPLFALAVLVSLSLVLVAIRWARSKGARIGILALYAALIPVAFMGPASLLGKAKPVSLEWFRAEVKEAEVLGARIVEGDGIYLMLVWDRVPRLYKLAWNRNAAQGLQDAMRRGRGNGARVMMRRPFERGRDDKKPLFYSPPQEALPPKRAPEGGIRFQHPGGNG